MRKKSGKTDKVNLADLMTLNEAAQLRGVSSAAISELVRRGRLRTRRLFGRVLVYRSEVENFIRDKPGPKHNK